MGRELGFVLVVGVAVVLAGAVPAAVHHAEVVTHRVGEPSPAQLTFAAPASLAAPPGRRLAPCRRRRYNTGAGDSAA